MSSEIGTAAGKVWQFLNGNGPATLVKIQKAIGANTALTNQAIGWLAREDKLVIDQSKKTATYALRQ